MALLGDDIRLLHSDSHTRVCVHDDGAVKTPHRRRTDRRTTARGLGTCGVPNGCRRVQPSRRRRQGGGVRSSDAHSLKACQTPSFAAQKRVIIY